MGSEEIIILEIKPTSHTGVLLSSSSTKGDYIVLEMIGGNVSIACSFVLCELFLLRVDEELFLRELFVYKPLTSKSLL